MVFGVSPLDSDFSSAILCASLCTSVTSSEKWENNKSDGT